MAYIYIVVMSLCATYGLARIPVSSRFFLHLSRLQADFFFYDAAREPGIIEKNLGREEAEQIDWSISIVS